MHILVKEEEGEGERATGVRDRRGGTNLATGAEEQIANIFFSFSASGTIWTCVYDGEKLVLDGLA